LESEKYNSCLKFGIKGHKNSVVIRILR